jgi:hypothetical protein
MESKIWTPDETSKPAEDSKQIKVNGTILNAAYHPLQKALIIAIRLPNGDARSCVDYASSHTFHGIPYKDVLPEEIDREMEKTAELYRRRKGCDIVIQIYENQLESKLDSI